MVRIVDRCPRVPPVEKAQINLRRKIEPSDERRYIRTEPGIGYRFAA
jgi:DNA-binding response OmpR family regulator